MVEYFYKKGPKYVFGESKTYQDFKALCSENSRNKFACILIQEPTEQELASLAKDFNIQERPLKKFKTENRSMRYNFNPLTFTLIDYYTEKEKIKINRLLFIVKNNLLILLTSENSNYYKELFKRVTTNAKNYKTNSLGYVMYEFLHEDAKDNYDVLELMEDKIELLEQKVLGDTHEKIVTHDIVALKKELLKMSKRLWASSKVIFTIKRDLTSIKLTKEDQALLEDIYDTFLHQIDMVETLKETVTDYLEIFTTTISNRLAITSNELNSVMKKMAALTIIIMVPTLIAGVYGTNFDNLPEIHWKYGYFLMIIAMIIASIGTYLLFHKRKWI